MDYIPLNYDKINLGAGFYSPSPVKSINNDTYAFWVRSLFQRAQSVLVFDNLPDEWGGAVTDFMYYCLYKFGFVSVFNTPEFGFTFQPCTVSGYSWYYQPTEAIVANPAIRDTLRLKIGADCEILKLTPDYRGIWDIIAYYAEKLSQLDTAINMSIINNKFAYIVAGNNNAAVQALKKTMDCINRGDPAVFVDKKIVTDPKYDPFTFIERTGMKQNYLTTDQLKDFQTLINNFDCEIGIPTIPYEKKERMVEAEADSRQIDSVSRATVWLETLQRGLEVINRHFDKNISVDLRYKQEQAQQEVSDNEQS